MQSGRSTTELNPLVLDDVLIVGTSVTSDQDNLYRQLTTSRTKLLTGLNLGEEPLHYPSLNLLQCPGSLRAPGFVVHPPPGTTGVFKPIHA
jgi:hypothetical protein